MRTLAIVPARAGSKGIPGKNVRLFRGKPLLVHAVEIGRATCDDTIVTTDSLAYADIAMKARAAAVIRPERLAADHTPMLDVVRHVVELFKDREYDAVVLLQPTQPLRTAEHVRAALKTLSHFSALDSVVSVVRVPEHYRPDYVCDIDYWGHLQPWGHEDRNDASLSRVLRRQDARPAYSRDGTVYAIKRQTIERGSLYGENCHPLLMSPHESVNLDTEDDWQRAEAMVTR